MIKKLYPKNPKPFYVVNWSDVHNTRVTEVTMKNLLRDAKKFLAGVKHGYIIRCAKFGAKVVAIKDFDMGGSATEARRIEGILNAWNK